MDLPMRGLGVLVAALASLGLGLLLSVVLGGVALSFRTFQPRVWVTRTFVAAGVPNLVVGALGVWAADALDWTAATVDAYLYLVGASALVGVFSGVQWIRKIRSGGEPPR